MQRPPPPEDVAQASASAEHEETASRNAHNVGSGVCKVSAVRLTRHGRQQNRAARAAPMLNEPTASQYKTWTVTTLARCGFEPYGTDRSETWTAPAYVRARASAEHENSQQEYTRCLAARSCSWRPFKRTPCFAGALRARQVRPFQIGVNAHARGPRYAGFGMCDKTCGRILVRVGSASDEHVWVRQVGCRSQAAMVKACGQSINCT